MNTQRQYLLLQLSVDTYEKVCYLFKDVNYVENIENSIIWDSQSPT